jgi:hypothetical protein
MACLAGEVAVVLGFSLLNSFKLHQSAKHFGEMQDEKLSQFFLPPIWALSK